MDPDFDPFGDLPGPTQARASRKFKPRAKPGPARVTDPSSVTSVPPNNTEEKSGAPSQNGLETEESLKSVDTAECGLASVVGSSLASSALLWSQGLLKNDGETLKFELGNALTHAKGDLASSRPLTSEVTVPNCHTNVYSSCSITEADSLDHHMDLSVRIAPETLSNERDGDKFQLQGTVAPEKGTSVPVPLCPVDGETDKSIPKVPYVSSTAECIEPTGLGNTLADPAFSSPGVFEAHGAKDSARDGGLLGFDSDHFGDIISQQTLDRARAGGKFKPRAKTRPSFGAVNSTAAPDTNMEKASSPSISGVEALLSDGHTISGLMNLSQPVDGQALGSVVASGDAHSELEKPMGENADIFSGLKIIQDFATHTTSCSEVSNENAQARSCFEGQSSGNSSAFQESGAFVSLEGQDILEHCIGTFQTYPKVQSGNEYFSGGDPPQDAVDSAIPPSDVQYLDSETVHLDGDSIPMFPSNDVLYYSTMNFSGCIDPDPSASDFPMSKEQTCIIGSNHADDMNTENLVDAEGAPEEIPNDGKSSRKLRKQATAPRVVDHLEDEEHDHGQFHTDPSTSSVLDEEDDHCEYRVDEEDDDNDDTEYVANGKSCNRRSSKKPMKPVTEKEKVVRNRKRANNAPEQSTQKPRKKFSHSTRRKKDRVKDLLSIPEYEIDRLRLPVKDILLLEEHKQQLAKKEAKGSKAPVSNQSANNSFGTDVRDEEDPFATEQDEGSMGDQTNSQAGPSYTLFNSHSFMNREPKVRWSKQDTELFYEGIRQFGSDLSMVQQLFPGRTRNQIKKKFKKEEYQHPLRLSEALSSRANDHSYFKKVIEHLQNVSAKSEPVCNKDDSDSIMGEDEPELEPVTDGEAAKSGQVDEGETAKSKLDEDIAVEMEGAEAVGNDMNDDDIWNLY